MRKIVQEAIKTVSQIYEHTKYIDQLEEIVNRAIKLAENDEADTVNIRHLGQG